MINYLQERLCYSIFIFRVQKKLFHFFKGKPNLRCFRKIGGNNIEWIKHTIKLNLLYLRMNWNSWAQFWVIFCPDLISKTVRCLLDNGSNYPSSFERLRKWVAGVTDTVGQKEGILRGWLVLRLTTPLKRYDKPILFNINEIIFRGKVAHKIN